MSGDVSSIYIYNGVDEVPEDVTHVRVNPSVTVIPDNAFYRHRQLEVVELPEGLTAIERQAFSNCMSLERINIPSTVEEIGESAFGKCHKLDGITLPKGLQRLGEYAFRHCKSLRRIHIPPGIEVLEEGAFLSCHSLTDITFYEGLREIGEDGFSRCTSLVSITLPCSLKYIGIESFEGCEVLNEVHMPDTIETIQARTFKRCNFTNFQMPPSIGNDLDISILDGNISLVSLELPETVTKEHLDDNYASGSDGLINLRNIALPTECEIDACAFHNCTDLRKAFPDAKNDYSQITETAIDSIKHRFDDLPIHKLCYYQSYHDNEITLQHLKRTINPWTAKPPGQLNTTGKEKDCLGMTPLHILACSTKPTIEMYRLLIDKYPETLIMKDKWGDISLLYALWCNVPTEVLDLLVESYKSLHPNYKINWKGMLETMAKRRVPLTSIQNLFNTQHQVSSDYNYNMQGIILQLAASDTGLAAFGRRGTSIETFRYLLRISVTDRLDSLGIRRWRIDLENCIKSLPEEGKYRDIDILAVYDRLAAYEIAKEATSVLELALWKAKIEDIRNKRARVDSSMSYKYQCRINSGADIIIRNVLPYLLPKRI